MYYSGNNLRNLELLKKRGYPEKVLTNVEDVLNCIKLSSNIEVFPNGDFNNIVIMIYKQFGNKPKIIPHNIYYMFIIKEQSHDYICELDDEIVQKINNVNINEIKDIIKKQCL